MKGHRERGKGHRGHGPGSGQGLQQVELWSKPSTSLCLPQACPALHGCPCRSTGPRGRGQGGWHLHQAILSPVRSLTGCPLSSCSSPGCPWSRAASTRPAASAWARETPTADGVSFTTREYLLGFVTAPALLVPITCPRGNTGRGAKCCLSPWLSQVPPKRSLGLARGECV